MEQLDNRIYKRKGNTFVPVGVTDELFHSCLSDGLWWIHTESSAKCKTNYSWMTQLFGSERIKFSPKAICNIHDESEELCKKFFQTHQDRFSMQEFAVFILSNIYESDKAGTK